MNCNRKKQCHKEEATATTSMVGSTFGLPPSICRLSLCTVNNFTLNGINLANIIRPKNTCSGNRPTKPRHVCRS